MAQEFDEPASPPAVSIEAAEPVLATVKVVPGDPDLLMDAGIEPGDASRLLVEVTATHFRVWTLAGFPARPAELIAAVPRDELGPAEVIVGQLKGTDGPELWVDFVDGKKAGFALARGQKARAIRLVDLLND